jgi:hypothetical protein
MPNKEAKRRAPPGGLVSDAIVIGVAHDTTFIIVSSTEYGVNLALSGGCRAIDLIEENAITGNMHKLMRN